jgi:putative addiction module component (TIGR02574 family)
VACAGSAKEYFDAMSVKKFLAAAKKLPFDERVELAHRLWDEFMDGFQDWKAPPIPKGKFPWKTLKAEIDAKLSRTDRIELAQQVWSNIIENGYDWELAPEQVAELDRRIADFEKNPQDGIPFEQIQAEMKLKYGWK